MHDLRRAYMNDDADMVPRWLLTNYITKSRLINYTVSLYGTTRLCEHDSWVGKLTLCEWALTPLMDYLEFASNAFAVRSPEWDSEGFLIWIERTIMDIPGETMQHMYEDALETIAADEDITDATWNDKTMVTFSSFGNQRTHVMDTRVVEAKNFAKEPEKLLAARIIETVKFDLEAQDEDRWLDAINFTRTHRFSVLSEGLGLEPEVMVELLLQHQLPPGERAITQWRD